MTETTLCGYCVDLPEKGRAAAREITRCPLCKTELGSSAAGGRFRVGAAPVPTPRLWKWLAGLATTAGAVCLVLVAWIVLQPRPRVVEIVILPPPPAPIVKTESDAEPPAIMEIARAKPYTLGVLSPDARAKPAAGSFDAVPTRLTVALGEDSPKARAELPVTAPKTLAQSNAVDSAALIEKVELRGQKELLDAPEVSLDPAPAFKDIKEARQRQQEFKDQLAKRVAEIHAKNGKEPDGFIRFLRQDRDDLQGLPFILGKACQLSETQAHVLAETSPAIRDALGQVFDEKQRKGSSDGGPGWEAPYGFWFALAKQGDGRYLGALKEREHTAVALMPALVQILAPMPGELRLGVVAHYRAWKRPEVSVMLARLAVYDPDPRVREDALDALREHPQDQYRAVLVDALCYPWARVAQRAADAAVTLNCQELIPQLIGMLESTDPAALFIQEVNGQRVTALREMVRINHHRNCLLCHAPSQGSARRQVPVGLVPSPADPLPPSFSRAYYQDRSGGSLARADVTYLRQDFSMMLAVENVGPWPKMQRFDFLVRTRVLTDAEVEAWQAKQGGKPSLSAHQQAALSALRRLTNLDCGPNAAEWRAATHLMSAAQPDARVENQE
jgi:hypothetical protein